MLVLCGRRLPGRQQHRGGAVPQIVWGDRRQVGAGGERVEADADPAGPQRRPILPRERPARVGPLGAPGEPLLQLCLTPGFQRLGPMLVGAGGLQMRPGQVHRSWTDTFRESPHSQ